MDLSALKVTRLSLVGRKLYLYCVIDVMPAQYRVAVRDDQFILTRRFASQDCSLLCEVGYRDLLRARERVIILDECDCYLAEKPVTLGPSTAAIRGLEWTTDAQNQISERIKITLTYGNAYARWLAMLTAVSRDLGQGRDNPAILLRTPGVCAHCFVKKASNLDGSLILVL